jgi:hypothetical protein
LPEENTNKDSESNARVIPDIVVQRFGYAKPVEPLYMKHPSGARVKLNVEKYDIFTCKQCRKDYAFLLPKGAIPCHLHTDSICCSCCMRNGTSNYCIGKHTSYVMAR